MAAYNQANGQSAILDFGPDINAPQYWRRAIPLNVPGDTNYASHMATVDEVKRDYASITIQTNPEDAQKAINAINSMNASLTSWNTLGPNCTTVCRDILHKILGLNTNSIRPAALWQDAFIRWSKQAQQPRQQTSRGSSPPQVRATHGVDYGQPRYGMNTFDFIWLLLHPPQAEVKSKFCYTGDDKKKVCQE